MNHIMKALIGISTRMNECFPVFIPSANVTQLRITTLTKYIVNVKEKLQQEQSSSIVRLRVLCHSQRYGDNIVHRRPFD